MKNETNIYDVDGNIIRKAGDNHKFTIEEIEKLVDDLTEKVRQNPENQVYKVYLNNAQAYLYNMYNHMSTEELAKRISILQDSIKEAQSEESNAEKEQLTAVAEAMERLKAEYDAEEPKETIMDEYVQFEEVKNEGNKENIHTLHSGESETDSSSAPEGVQE